MVPDVDNSECSTAQACVIVIGPAASLELTPPLSAWIGAMARVGVEVYQCLHPIFVSLKERLHLSFALSSFFLLLYTSIISDLTAHTLRDS